MIIDGQGPINCSRPFLNTKINKSNNYNLNNNLTLFLLLVIILLIVYIYKRDLI